MSQAIEVKVPDIGIYEDVPVIEILVKEGDKVEAEQSLITLESDKATMDVPSPVSGIVMKVNVKAGDMVSKGSLIALLESSDNMLLVPSTPEVTPEALVTHESTAQTLNLPVSPSLPGVDHFLGHASPSIRKFARELGVNASHMHGTGQKGRITKEDVTNFVKVITKKHLSLGDSTTQDSTTQVRGELNLLPWPKTDFSKFGLFELSPLSRVKKISGANLHRNWVMIPHITNNDNADITDLEALRVQLNKEYANTGVKFTVLSFVIKAIVSALKKFPIFNSSLDEDKLVLKKYFHIGFAVDTDNGLKVPVIWDVNKKGLIDIAKEVSGLSKAAREGKLKNDQMKGGCFSISSLGGIGGAHFTPIINAPEVAILGLSRGITKPVWNGRQFMPRLIMPLSLSYDHRVIDGAEAARFNSYLIEMLYDFRRVSL